MSATVPRPGAGGSPTADVVVADPSSQLACFRVVWGPVEVDTAMVSGSSTPLGAGLGRPQKTATPDQLPAVTRPRP
ncbi:hypothetical protein [Streptomyces sp. C184]|uniref:hypothetical protein n=1 Tax=Streptomyces sp. C184 TaxID=3237121 RepID=UPI0034C69F86